MDGKHTLDEAQKAFEKRFRPDRLTLEDLEAFAQQLLHGRAGPERVAAGRQAALRPPQEAPPHASWLQTFTNILYIKIPVFDPDPHPDADAAATCGWIFTTVVLLLVSVALHARRPSCWSPTHFDTFRGKLPAYQEFFSFKTVVYLWIALGVVKVIHEFGHGLSCKAFGGEVHEMGFLFLCFSPALYCNVSDAWTLPNKWKRIIISVAGIYVELIIAAIATFVWWNTPTPAVHQQPVPVPDGRLLRQHGRVQRQPADALRRLLHPGRLAGDPQPPRPGQPLPARTCSMEHCLGIEVPPEPYMALWRQDPVRHLRHHQLRLPLGGDVLHPVLPVPRSCEPYKLEIISNMLALAALASMIGWPLYRLVKNIHKRGRLPDMKRGARASPTAPCLAAVAAVRLLRAAAGQPACAAWRWCSRSPTPRAKVFVRDPRHPGEAQRPRRPARHARATMLAEFSNRELDAEIDAAQTEADISRRSRRRLHGSAEDLTTDLAERGKIDLEITRTQGDRDKALSTVARCENLKRRELVLLAPRDGIVSGAPGPDDIGKYYDKDQARRRSAPSPSRAGSASACRSPRPSLNQLRENVDQPEPRPHASPAIGSTRR